MDNRTRFCNVLNFEPVDRLPVTEWAPWWDKTIARWKHEGLPAELDDGGEILRFFGLDMHRQCWIVPQKQTFPRPESHGKGVVADMDTYLRVKEHLYPEIAFDKDSVARCAIEHRRGDLAVWITLNGFFWFPRELFGIDGHLYAFYDNPELMHAMNRDQLQFNLRVLDEFCALCTPEFMTFAEDLSYNKGPMISKRLFDEFLAPYYRQIVPHIKEYGIVPFVDTDGNPTELVPWFTDVGIEGFLPLERQAGVDIVSLRKTHPRLRMIGGYDKMVMNKGESAMRAEFDRIFPVMKQGGYIPGVDHQTPPGVSFDDYQVYLQLLKEYCVKAAQ